MNLPRHSISSHAVKPLFVNAQFAFVPSAGQTYGDSNVRPSKGGDINTAIHSRCMLSCATNDGFFVARTDPTEIVVKRQYSALQGGLSHALLIDDTSLVVLVGGGRVPRYAPNKVILWDQQASPAPQMLQDPDVTSQARGTSGDDRLTKGGVYIEDDDTDESLSNDNDDPSSFVALRDPEAIPLPDSIFGASALEAAQAEEAGMEDSLSIHGVKNAEMDAPLLAQSVTGSLVSSTANLADPFESNGPDVKYTRDQDTSSATRPSLPRHAEAAKEPRLAQDRTTPRKHTGSEVAELEFSELVHSVNVGSLTRMGWDGRLRQSALLIVQLRSKALIFEIGPALTETGLQASHTSQAWGVRQRAVLEIDANSSDCVPAIAFVKDTHTALIALTGRQTGHVQLVSIPMSDPSSPLSSTNVSVSGASVIFAAHTNAIRRLALSQHGNLLCTASEKGTLLRLWSTDLPSMTSARHGKPTSARAVRQMNVALVAELRRGTDSAHILSIVFSPNDALLAAASEKGTIHFFELKNLSGGASTQSSKSAASFAAGARESRSFRLSKQAEKYLPSALQSFAQSIPVSVLPDYFSSRWSSCQYKIDLKVFSGRTSNPMRHVRAPRKGISARQAHGQFDLDENDDGNGDGEKLPGSQRHTQRHTSVGDVFVPRNDRNLEGGWATMRGRMSDIRRGERSIAESIWLTFIPASSPSMRSQSPLDVANRRIRPGATTGDYEQGSSGLREHDALSDFHLLAATNSGNLYRIAVIESDADTAPKRQGSSGDRPSSASTVLNMYKTDDRTSTGSRSTTSRPSVVGDQRSCRLVEHIRLLVNEDDWFT